MLQGYSIFRKSKSSSNLYYTKRITMLYIILGTVQINITSKNSNSSCSLSTYMILIYSFGIKYNTLWKIDFISTTEDLYLLLTIANCFWELCLLIFTGVNELKFHLEFRFLGKKSNMKSFNYVKKSNNKINYFIVLFTLLSLSNFFL